jgi:hypothetical protein
MLYLYKKYAEQLLHGGKTEVSSKSKNIMKKLESLKSLKFKEMSASQMNTFKGGVVQATNNKAYSQDGGKTWIHCADRYDTVLKCTEYLINGVWY